MTKFIQKALVLSMAVTFIFSNTSCDKEDDKKDNPAPKEVTIPDALLREQIKSALGLSSSEAITEANILLLDTLKMAGEDDLTGAISDISDLTGLEKATNLIYLRFGGTKVTDITPIAGLRKVQYLRLNNTQVSDLSPLSQWTSLTYFNINTCLQITNISPIAGNTSLQEIIMRSVPFGDAGMSTFSNFNALYRLNIRETGVTDISVLVSMMQNGALQDSTPGAMENGGGATLDLRQNSVDCTLLDPYRANIANLDGC